MNDDAAAAATRPKGRRFLYHFTRASNLPAIASFDSLISSSRINPNAAGERRLKAEIKQVDDYPVTINAHLRIPERMIDPAITLDQFRACLDRHIFFWPTLADCRKMLDTYTRREPSGRFAVMEFDAYSLMVGHYSAVKLSKYDSGSAPRFPNHCSYRKGPDMFLPLSDFGIVNRSLTPAKASEIREVLVEDRVANLSNYLLALYVDRDDDAPERWRSMAKPLSALRSGPDGRR